MSGMTGQLEERMPQTSLWKDIFATTKIGIVNSNALTTFTGFWLALFYNGIAPSTSISTLVLTLVGSSLIIAGSCAINNYIDRDIDHLMERTRFRPSVTGKFKPNTVLTMGFVLLLVGMLLLAQTTLVATLIGGIGAFTYIVLYSLWTKRHYTINTVVGSVSGAVPPLIGWAAVDPDLHIVAWLLFFIMFIWQPPHFLALAMKRCEEYRAAGIPMLPVIHGFAMTKRQIMVWILCLLPLPFYLSSLGVTFVVIGTLLNIGWLVLGLYGYKKEDDIKWSVKMFVYSLNYLTILFISMIVVTLF
ncbi:protoheme IX farnesyltransferase [Priestia taiwanensis]|uniref:Protoheme IX farnesyltransferase n=2 Tax=Priestia taiwanensis TaxID=1347902 RepID=A0A917ENE2_9BACI|nr:protoheme IX farnesyltransferase [Priestia taiwanensis]